RALSIWKPQQRVSVCDVKSVADQRHSKGRMQIVDECRFALGDPVMVGVTQQDNAMVPGKLGIDGVHRSPHHQVFWPFHDLAGAIRFCNEHVTVG
ncbi:MAG: hypothetical protein ACJ8FG_03900, partial [Sphingomicrobium sp.]